MRSLPFALLSLGALAGCAGHVADYIGPRAPIITPQLTRYGFDATQTQCMGLRLGSGLSPLQLRLFARQASVVRQSFFGGGSLTPRDLAHVASTMDDAGIAIAFQGALSACAATAAAATAETVAPETGEAAAATPEVPAVRGPTWLNLGAAGSGQAIAVDAGSLVQEGNNRTAWFRLTNPGAQASTGLTYLLRIDCAARTISPRADRRQDAEGNVVESREYPPEEQGPLPIEGGTVMEIAFLSLCT
jgi:hypothetical protein